MIESPRILSIGSANPPQRWTQEEVLARFRVDDPRIRSLFQMGHIRTRHLYLPEAGADGRPQETQGDLLSKHLRGAMEIGPQAVERCLAGTDIDIRDVDHVCCVTTTGFLAPGLSAHLIKQIGLRTNVQRVDVVGMGCNAGLNALGSVASWARANPGRNALMVCIEVCSAAYVFDGSMRTGIVNSLFGDGAAAILVRADEADARVFAPAIYGFASRIIPDAIDAMRYDWDEEQHKFSFYLHPDIPYVVGAHAEEPVRELLTRFGLRKRDIAWWVVHSGGKKVIDAVKYNVGLSAWDVRHTTSVLRDFGNLSSGSFLFSLQRLLAEGKVRSGDWGMLMTMGPGSQIETALVRW